MKMPANIEPMKAHNGHQPFNDPGWEFEFKHDGYRIVAYVEKGNVKLKTRNGQDYSGRFPQITAALQKWKFDAIVDGEIVVLDMEGFSDFNALQNWHSDEDGPLYYYVFDLLWYNGKDYRNEPLYKRKNTLKSILPKGVVVLYCDEIMTYGKALFKMAKKYGLEGIIAKKVDSIYVPGARSKEWLKLKTTEEKDFIICGYTRNEGSVNKISSLILGAYQGKRLEYAGQVGSGISDQAQRDILDKLKPIERKKCAFPVIPEFNDGGWGRKKPAFVSWCMPKLVCKVKYLERTKYGELRQASFKGLRTDKEPVEVQLE